MQTICDDFEVKLPMMQSAVDLETFVLLVAKHIRKATEPTQPFTSTALPIAHLYMSQQLTQETDVIFIDDEDLLGDFE